MRAAPRFSTARRAGSIGRLRRHGTENRQAARHRVFSFSRANREMGMSGVRVLVGTRKGAFVLTADGKRKSWDVSGPHFAGWEIYHMKGSPVDPNRLYASQSSGWFGQQIQRSDDGGKSWEPVDNTFAYEGEVGNHLF